MTLLPPLPQPDDLHDPECHLRHCDNDWCQRGCDCSIADMPRDAAAAAKALITMGEEVVPLRVRVEEMIRRVANRYIHKPATRANGTRMVAEIKEALHRLNESLDAGSGYVFEHEITCEFVDDLAPRQVRVAVEIYDPAGFPVQRNFTISV